MKKSLVVFSIFCLFVLASCSKLDEEDIFPEDIASDTGTNTNEPDSDTSDTDISDSDITDSDNNDTTPEQPDTGDTSDSGADTSDTSDTDITDSDNNDTGADTSDSSADTGDSGTDTGDTGADTGDTGADTGDSGADTGDTGADTGDTGADTGDTGADTGDTGADTGDTGADTGDSGADTGDTGADEPHECSVNPATPCKAAGLIWSSRSSAPTDWEHAGSGCTNWSEGTFTSGWRLPKINELRKVMKNCATTEFNGNCGVTDECAIMGTDINGIACYTNSACKKVFGDICSPSLEHSPFGETGKLWTALKTQDDPDWAWYVSFYNGEIAWAPYWTNDEIYYRCVHDL